MKKLLALLLSVMMAASLAVPAFADGPDGPAPDGYDGQVEAVPISAILDESIGIIGGADGPTSIITTGPLGGFDLESFKWDGYDLEGLDPDSIDWAELGKQLQERQKQLIDEQKQALGGVPGQIGLMVNGAYIQFPDAAPEVSGDGTTMAPVRALVEAMGGEVKVDGDKVACTVGDVTMTFEMNDADVDVERQNPGDGEFKTEWVTMPIVAYVKDGRTYVPVRFTAQTLGYEVGWDSAFETAILVNRAALAEQYDEHFTIMNRVQANRVSGWETGRSLSADMKGNVTVTAFDTLNGNTTYQADFTSKVLMNTQSISGAYSFKMSDNIVDLLVGQYAGSMDEEVLERMRLVLDALEDVEVIMTKDGLAWVHSPVLDELGGEKDIWCGMEMDADEVQTAFAGVDAATMGTALAAMVSTDSVMDYSATAGMAAQLLFDLYGDDKFTTVNGTSTLTIGLEELAELYADYGLVLDFLEEVYKECEITIKVDSEGGATVACVMETSAQSGLPGMKLTMDCTQSGGKVELSMDLHIANMGELKLTLNSTQQATDEKPMTEPPAGANIVDAPELLNS